MMTAQVSPGVIETNLRTLAQTKRIRVTEFFQDFDKLRSGYITEPQFFRCLWQTLGVQLSKEEADALAEKYDLKKNGQINYKLFCEAIDRHFNPKSVDRNPEAQRNAPLELLGTMRSVRPLSTAAEEKLAELLDRMNKYYQVHGINLRTCYEDFDRHHMGIVTESQFYRNFPGPPDISEQDISMLLSKYRDPEKQGILNYLNLHNDIVASANKEPPPDPRKLPEVNLNIAPCMWTSDPTLNHILDKIRVAVFKYGIRTIEFFKDHDKLRSGAITDNQFLCGLSLSVGTQAQLSRPEMQKVCEYFRQSDGRVKYKEFCDIMENAFNIPDLEKKPTEEVVRPKRGELWRTLKPLSDEEEARLNQVLRELSDNVRRRRLMMYPYFKDYDRGIAYTRVVTKSQFARILHFLSLNVNSTDLQLLCQKFEDPATGDVNYPLFVQAVDQEFVGHTMDDVSLQDVHRTKSPVPERIPPEPEITFDELMAQIRHIVLTNRIRLGEYMEDFDPLRSGSITKSQFRRGLSLMGLSKLGWHDLTDGQHQMLCDCYQDPSKVDNVLYAQFIKDVESVFTESNLEKNPTFRVPPSKMFVVPKPGTVRVELASEEHSDLFNKTMDRLRQRVEQRRVLVEPVFQDFDRHNNGHVTQNQFRQCLRMLDLNATEAELAAIEAIFCNDVGFNYIAFVSQLQPKETPKFMYQEIQDLLNQTNQQRRLPERNCMSDLENVLLKIKTKVAKERVRTIDFMRDYDKLHSGRVLKNLFRRALTLCRFDLCESEMAILEDRYQSEVNPDYVDYVKFCDEIESIFTQKELEKAPLADVSQFTVPEEWQENKLQEQDHTKFRQCMERIAEKVRQRRMQLFPLFEDYDRVHNGTVTRSQFRRVLTELELNNLVTQEEIQLIWQQFEVKVGGISDVNYIAFCDVIYDIGKFEWRKP